jgi:hypothetical protein
MKANELRIGNKVYNEAGIIDTITDIEECRVGCKKSAYPYTCIDDIKPVLITEEILLKCGFVFKNQTYSIMLNSADSYLEIRIVNNEYYPAIFQISEMSCENNNTVFLNKIDNIHQLQNLYFALTNEELTINL